MFTYAYFLATPHFHFLGKSQLLKASCSTGRTPGMYTAPRALTLLFGGPAGGGGLGHPLLPPVLGRAGCQPQKER